MPTQYDDKKTIPQPYDMGTPEYAAVERIRAFLPTIRDQAEKALKVKTDESGGEWGEGGGGASSFAELQGNPTDNTALRNVLASKVDIDPNSDVPFTVGCDASGLYVLRS